MRNLKKSTAILLAVVLLFSLMLCSCKKNSDDEQTTTTTESYQDNNNYAPSYSDENTTDAQVVTDAVATTQAVQSTQAIATTKASQQASSTQAQNNAPVNVSGVASITDGNKTVVYPKAVEANSKKYPVIVWANGTGCPTASYMALLEALANGGYIVVADATVMSADGTAQINSIDYILDKNNDSSSVFYNKVDASRVGATGHSQGGRSAVNAAQADSRIKCIVSIAGASSEDEARGLKAPALFLTGTADMIVVSSQWCKPSYDVVAGRAVYASLKGAGHTVCMTNQEKVSGYILSWFDGYLKGDANAKNVFVAGGKLATDSNWQDFACKN